MSKSNNITIVDTTIQIVEYMGSRVVTFEMMDNLHHRPKGTTNKKFESNQERFIEGKHFYLIDFSKSNEFRPFGIEIPPHGLTVLTERGYSMLVKSFTDDFAWDVQEQLSDSYFNNQQPMSPAEIMLQQAHINLAHEQRLKKIEDRQVDTDVRIAETRSEVKVVNDKSDKALEAAQAALTHKVGSPNHSPVSAYFSSKGCSLDAATARLYGVRATQLSRARNLTIYGVPDERWGKVNAYEFSILEEIFQSHQKELTVEDLKAVSKKDSDEIEKQIKERGGQN